MERLGGLLVDQVVKKEDEKTGLLACAVKTGLLACAVLGRPITKKVWFIGFNILCRLNFTEF